MALRPKNTLSIYLPIHAFVLGFFLLGGLLRNSLWPLVNNASPSLLLLLVGGPVIFVGILCSILISITDTTEKKRRDVARITMLSSFFVIMVISCYAATITGVAIFTKTFSPVEFQELQWQTKTLASVSTVTMFLFTFSACKRLVSFLSTKKLPPS
ncbi:MAG: hypothetical protein HYY92_01180 [Parcubacteria group bacterium]|nr:hypothetical protein [Parcubacteria group bacterium]